MGRSVVLYTSKTFQAATRSECGRAASTGEGTSQNICLVRVVRVLFSRPPSCCGSSISLSAHWGEKKWLNANSRTSKRPEQEARTTRTIPVTGCVWASGVFGPVLLSALARPKPSLNLPTSGVSPSAWTGKAERDDQDTSGWLAKSQRMTMVR